MNKSDHRRYFAKKRKQKRDREEAKRKLAVVLYRLDLYGD